MTTMVNALNKIVHPATRAIQEGRRATMQRIGAWGRANPSMSAGILGGLAGGTYGAFSDNTSVLGGALGGASLAGGSMFGWKNRGGIMGAAGHLKNSGFTGMGKAFDAGNKNQSIRGAIAGGRIKKTNGRFSML